MISLLNCSMFSLAWNLDFMYYVAHFAYLN